MAALTTIAPPLEAGGARLIDPSFIVPDPMPGESVRSFWERFHRLTPLATTKETLAALFGPGATQRFGHRLPPKIAKLALNVGSTHPFGNVRTIVEKHSSLPFSCFFHTGSQRELAYNALTLHRGAASARAVTGDAIRDIRADRPWPAFCPQCARQDMATGFTYWRVVHQLPTVVVCPEHGCRLRERRPPGKALDITLLSDFPPPNLLVEDESTFPLVEVDARIESAALLRLAKASAYMLGHPNGFNGDFRTGMYAVLREMGLRSRNGLNHAAITRLVIDVHGAPMIEWLGMGEVLKPNGPKVLRRLLGFRRERSSTERYLLLALAIKPDLPSLETDTISLRENPGVTRNSFLPAWVQKLPEDRKNGFSVEELAAKYKVSRTMMRRYLIRVGETLDGRSRRLSEDAARAFFEAARSGQTSSLLRKRFSLSKHAVPLLLEQDPVSQARVERADFVALRDIHRARALATMERHPGITAELLAKKLSRIQQLLRRYDLKWCQANLPKPSSLGRWTSIWSDATQVDDRLSKQVTATIHILRDAERVPLVTQDLVLSRCRATNVFLHHKGRLPKTRDAFTKAGVAVRL